MAQVEAKVTLVRMTQDAQELIAASGRLCYASNTEQILQQDSEKSDQFIRRIIKMGHMSLMEHASFTFYIEGVSRAMTHQLVRHRHASYSQRSQRYVEHNSFDFIIPPQFKEKIIEVNGRKIDAIEYYIQTMELIAQRYSKLNNALGRKGEKSNEDARYVLPNACETKIFVTMNARELLHFFEHRLCLRAQWEIRHVAEQMLQIVKEICPAVFNDSGPKCVRLGKCPEGKYTCGKFAEIQEKYKSTVFEYESEPVEKQT